MTTVLRELESVTAPAWELRFGARPQADGRTVFRVWAPRAKKLEVKVPGDEPRTFALEEAGEGVFEARVDGVSAGADYFYVLNGNERPDPVSRFQPAGVHGPSRVVEPEAFEWTDKNWKGLALKEYVVYELHTGTFTPEGTFESVIPKLAHLKSLGITAVELMPVAEFPGARNWGYDGAHLYAPQSSYGGPEGLKRLIDACHREGLAFVLDVVYNHLGPEGNYAGEYMPLCPTATRRARASASTRRSAGSPSSAATKRARVLSSSATSHTKSGVSLRRKVPGDSHSGAATRATAATRRTRPLPNASTARSQSNSTAGTRRST